MRKVARENLKEPGSDERKEQVDKLREESQTLKGRINIELRKLKEMDGRTRRQHIWHYYRMHIIATILIVGFSAHFIWDTIINTVPEPVLTIAWTGPWVPEEFLDGLADALAEHLVEDPDNERVQVLSFFSSEDPQFLMASIQRFAAMTTVGELDIVIGHLEEFDEDVLGVGMAQGWSFRDLQLYLSQAGVNPTANPIMIDDPWDDGPPFAFAVNMEDSPMMNQLGFIAENLYFGIIVNTPREEAVIKAISALWQN